jgi:inner membrane protein
MPTLISHAIISIPINLGIINKNHTWRILILSLLFSFLPDLEGVGFYLGIPYNSIFGHRGFSHSLFFIFIAAIVFVYLSSPKINLKSKVFFVIFVNFFIIGVVHILLDSMTNGGLGVALFSPFSNYRFFMPWRPIEVSAILPQYFFRLNGLAVIKFELIYFIIPSMILSSFILITGKKYNIINSNKKNL